MVTSARKDANERWKHKNKSTLACTVYKEDAEAFKTYAAEQGTTVNSLLQNYVAQCLGRPLTLRSTATE